MKKLVINLVLLVVLLSAATADAVLVDVVTGGEGVISALSGSTGVRYEEYCGNGRTGTSGVGERGNIMLLDSNHLRFVDPASFSGTTGSPIGLLVGAAMGSTPVKMLHADNSTAYYANDLMGPASGRPIAGAYGDRLVYTFVDPTDISKQATVSGIGMRFASVLANTLEIHFYDIDGNEIASVDSSIPGSSAAAPYNTSVGYMAKDDLGQELSIIHRVEVVYPNYTGNDYWVQGTYVDNAAKNDLSFVGFQVVPEPATVAILGLGFVFVRKRK